MAGVIETTATYADTPALHRSADLRDDESPHMNELADSIISPMESEIENHLVEIIHDDNQIEFVGHDDSLVWFLFIDSLHDAIHYVFSLYMYR